MRFQALEDGIFVVVCDISSPFNHNIHAQIIYTQPR